MYTRYLLDFSSKMTCARVAPFFQAVALAAWGGGDDIFARYK